MKTDYEPVVRLIHRDAPTRYERIEIALRWALMITALALMGWVGLHIMPSHSAQAAITPVCVDYGSGYYVCEAG